METKMIKLRSALKDAQNKHEQVLTYYYNLVLEKLNPSTTDATFEKQVVEFMRSRVTYANKFINKKKSKIFEEEIYCLSLLSINFLNGRYKPVIEGNKVVLNE